MRRMGGAVAERGFTLIELLIAVFLLVTALLGLISTTVIVIKSNATSKTVTTATTLAKDKMEQLKSTGYDQLLPGIYFDHATIESAVQTSPSAATVFKRTWEVTGNNPAFGMKTVDVTVEWSWQGAKKDVALKTIVAR